MMSMRRLFFSLAVVALLVGATVAQRTIDDVTLETSQAAYYFGDLVEFTLTNASDSTLTMGSSPPWTIYSVTTGQHVFPENSLTVEVYLGPGESESWQWDQQHYSGGQVTAGFYYVALPFSYGTHGTGGGGVLADTFEVKDPTPVRRSTWGQIRDLWR